MDLNQKEIAKGYITEAIQKEIEVIFNEFGLHRIEANILFINNGKELYEF